MNNISSENFALCIVIKYKFIYSIIENRARKKRAMRQRMQTNNCHKSDRPNSIGCRIPWRHCQTSSTLIVERFSLKIRSFRQARVHHSPRSFASPSLPSRIPVAVSSLGCTFPNAAKRRTPFDTSNTSRKAAQ